MNKFYRMAVTNIGEKGDTDIFPFPIEKYLFQDKKTEILRILEQMDKNFDNIIQVEPIDCIKTSVPNNYRGFRWATMIDPLWNAFYLGEVLKISEQIDSKRIPAGQECVFSYRLKYERKTGLLFDQNYNYKAFNKAANKLAEQHKYIINFDIADFYNSISHEKLRDVLLNNVKADGSAVNRIMEIISKIAGQGETYSLPIGGNASRILAESYLIPADRYMTENKIRFCRFVDDYYVFAKSLNEAYTLLNNCADYFRRNLGLSFQKSKTSVMSKSDFMTHSKAVDEEVGKEKDPVKASILSLKLGIDKYQEMGNEELRGFRDKINGSELVRLLKMECKKTEINPMFSKQMVNAVQILDDKDKSAAFAALSENFEKLYPIFPVIMRKAFHNLNYCSAQVKKTFYAKLMELFDKNSYIIQTDNNAAYALRLLSLNNSRDAKRIINDAYKKTHLKSKAPSDMVKMNAFYSMTNLRNVSWILERLNEFPKLSSWERRAASAALAFAGPKANRWSRTHENQLSKIELLTWKWVSEKLSSNPNWRLPL